MIKKSRKILTLLLASLLIMSSMCALTVSADDATSYEITDGTTVINSSNKTKSYTFTHSLETGYYTLKVGVTVPTVDNKMLTIQATIGSDSWSGDHRFTSTSRTITTGTFYLTQGASYTVDLAGTFGTTQDVTITKLTFEKFTNIVQLSTTEENKVSVLDYFNRKFRTGNTDRESSNYSWASTSDDTTVKSKAVLTANCFVINRVSVPSDTWYDVYSMAGTTSSYKPKLTLSVDDTAVISGVTATQSALTTLKYTHLGKIKLTAGTHDLKLLTSGTMYLAGMRLVPCSLNTDIAVSSSNSPEFSFYNDKVTTLASSFTAGAASYGPPSIAEGQDFTLDGTDGYVSAASGDYATYLVNVTEAGMYDINFIGGQRQVKLNILVDGAQPAKSLSATCTMGTADTVNSNVVKAKISTVYLTQGIHEIKFEFTNSAANWLYKWIISPTTEVTNLSATGTTTIMAGSTKYYNYTDDSSEISSEYVVARASKTYYYVVNAPAAGQYTLTTNQAGPNGGIKMTVTDVNADTVLYTGSMGNHTENYSTYTIEDVGTISLNAGVTVLKLTFSGARYFADFRLTPYVENKVIADINTEIAQGTGYQEVTVPVKFEGNLTLTCMEIGIGYDEGVQFVSAAADGGLVGIPTFSPNESILNPVKMAWLPTDYVNGNEITTGTLATFTFNVPKSTAKDYTFTVTVSDFYDPDDNNLSDEIITVNGKVSVVSTDPIITLTNASDETVADVVAGTMNVSVDLNGNEYDFVMFAIYTKEGDYTVLEYYDEATISGETATGKIENITLEDGKNYYAKVFVWDEATCYGFSQTFGE